MTPCPLGFLPHVQRQAGADLGSCTYPVDLFLHLAIAPVTPLHRIRRRGQQHSLIQKINCNRSFGALSPLPSPSSLTVQPTLLSSSHIIPRGMREHRGSLFHFVSISYQPAGS